MDGSAVDGWTALRAVGDEWVGRRGWLLLLGNTGRRCSVLSVEVKAFTGEWLPATDGRTLATQTDARTAVRYARCCTAPRWWCPHGASANLSCPASAVGLVRARTGCPPGAVARLVLSPPCVRRRADPACLLRVASGSPALAAPRRHGLSHEGHRSHMGDRPRSGPGALGGWDYSSTATVCSYSCGTTHRSTTSRVLLPSSRG